MQSTMHQLQQQQKSKRVQQKIKMMMKYKKMQKLTSQKDLAYQKPLSIYNDKASSKFDEISIKNKKNALYQNNLKDQQTFETYSSKRIKSIVQTDDMAPSSSYNLKDSSKKFILSNKQRKGLYDSSTMKKIPSAEKIQSNQQVNKESFKKLKRPSSVVNRSTRATSSRSRKQKPSQPEDQKQMQQKIRQIIPKCFQFGIKLQKYADEKSVDLNKEYDLLFGDEINIIRLISNSRKYYSNKVQNQEQQQTKLSNGVEKEIIQMLKKKKQKQAVIYKCENITSQIARLIDARLSALNKTKVALH